MSEHLTNQTRKVLAIASSAARSFNHDYVGTEHILLALVEESSTGVSEVLAMFGVNADNVRMNIETLVQRGTQPVSRRTLPLTPRSKRAIEHAADHARFVSEKCIAPEHLLLGLLQEAQGVAAQVLTNLGLKLGTLRTSFSRCA